MIKITDQKLNTPEEYGIGAKWGLIHELAHYWDWKAKKELSSELVTATGGSTTWGRYNYGGVPPKGADESFDRYEDFAESVTTFVYPGQAAAYIQAVHANNPRFHYRNYYQTPRAMYIATSVNMSWQAIQALQSAWNW